MANNYTNINKVNNHFSPQIIEYQKRPQHMVLEIQILVKLVQAQKCGSIKLVNDIQTHPFLTIGSPATIQT